jgi:hypothetical protein
MGGRPRAAGRRSAANAAIAGPAGSRYRSGDRWPGSPASRVLLRGPIPAVTAAARIPLQWGGPKGFTKDVKYAWFVSLINAGDFAEKGFRGRGIRLAGM